MEPTKIFLPFGLEGPKVALFGMNTGDWNMNRFQNRQQYDRGLYFRLRQLAETFRFEEIYIPTPTECNTRIASVEDFPENINGGPQSLRVMRGVCADGVVLPKGKTGAIASADCPTIVVYCSVTKGVIIGHGGSKSLVDVQHVLEGKPERKYSSVVDAMMDGVKRHGFRSPTVFITCGIRRYRYPELADYLSGTVEGSRSAMDDPIIHLHLLIADQFSAYGVDSVFVDTIDTYGDLSDGVGYTWHSYRRGRTPEEKARRNLVLVVNR